MLEVEFNSRDARVAGIELRAHRPTDVTGIQSELGRVFGGDDFNRVAEEIRDVLLKGTDAEQAARPSIIF